jgi:hypothetical protein
MCRYACDLQPMLKVLAGHQHIEKLLNIQNTVRVTDTYTFLFSSIKDHRDYFSFFSCRLI